MGNTTTNGFGSRNGFGSSYTVSNSADLRNALNAIGDYARATDGVFAGLFVEKVERDEHETREYGTRVTANLFPPDGKEGSPTVRATSGAMYHDLDSLPRSVAETVTEFVIHHDARCSRLMRDMFTALAANTIALVAANAGDVLKEVLARGAENTPELVLDIMRGNISMFGETIVSNIASLVPDEMVGPLLRYTASKGIASVRNAKAPKAPKERRGTAEDILRDVLGEAPHDCAVCEKKETCMLPINTHKYPDGPTSAEGGMSA